MKKITRLLTLLILALPGFSYAENMLVDTNVLYTIPDAGGTDDFHTGRVFNANYNYYPLSWLALTGGIFISEEIFDSTRTDIAGTFQASIETQGITLGVRPEYKFSKRNKMYARTGLLMYKTKLTVREFFDASLPSGTTSDTTDGSGYYVAIGWAHFFTPHVLFQLELATQKQLNLFDGKTAAENVFDLNTSGFSLGVGYAF